MGSPAASFFVKEFPRRRHISHPYPYLHITDSVPRHVSTCRLLRSLDYYNPYHNSSEKNPRRREQGQHCTNDWGQEASRTKTWTTLFSLSPKREDVFIKLRTDIIPKDSPTFIGANTTIDSHGDLASLRSHDYYHIWIVRLYWRLMETNIDTNSSRAVKRLRQVYIGTIRPVLIARR